MHAATIELHDALTRSARDLAYAWQNTDPMHSEEEVLKALVACNPYASEPSEEDRELLPYLCDVLRERGLLV